MSRGKSLRTVAVIRTTSFNTHTSMDSFKWLYMITQCWPDELKPNPTDLIDIAQNCNCCQRDIRQDTTGMLWEKTVYEHYTKDIMWGYDNGRCWIGRQTKRKIKNITDWARL